METAVLTGVELTSFKSFTDQYLPLDAITVLTGRNSAGKSNALDALEVLARMVGGEVLDDALDGRRREGGPIRGTARGCAPHGADEFALGCRVEIGDDKFTYRVRVRVAPEVRVVHEELRGPAPALRSGHIAERPLLLTRAASDESPGIEAEIHSGKRGANPALTFRDNRLLLTQLAGRVTGRNRPEQAVLRGASAVLSALAGVFHLDPVPHLMRGYWPARDDSLRRTAENISAAVHRLVEEDASTLELLRAAIDAVADQDVTALTTEGSPLGDVMLALHERAREAFDLTPAREMSDGLLRFLAIATALLTTDQGLDVDDDATTTGVRGGVLLVVEEIENGLHPSQAGKLLDLIHDSVGSRGGRVLVTSHSPALLNALTGSLNEHVVACYRDRGTGGSRLSRLVELPGYASALARGEIGDAVSRGELVRPQERARDLDEFDRLMALS